MPRDRALAAIEGSVVPDLLERHAGAVVLERMARGGGATRWFYVQSVRDLQDVARRLSPGSVVSFFFDGRLGPQVASPDLHQRLLRIIERTGDVVVGLLDVDGVSINVEFAAGPTDLAEWTDTLGFGSTVFVGAFPARDDDGGRAVTLTLPDADGVVRAHPH